MGKTSVDQQLTVLWRNFTHTNMQGVALSESLFFMKEFIKSRDAAPLFGLRNLAFLQMLARAESQAAAAAQGKPSPYQELLFGNDPDERVPVGASGKHYMPRAELTIIQLASSVEFREHQREKKIEAALAKVADPTIEADKRLIASMEPYSQGRRKFTVQEYLDLAAAGVPAPEPTKKHVRAGGAA